MNIARIPKKNPQARIHPRTHQRIRRNVKPSIHPFTSNIIHTRASTPYHNQFYELYSAIKNYCPLFLMVKCSHFLDLLYIQEDFKRIV
jgi:hypothetical protein